MLSSYSASAVGRFRGRFCFFFLFVCWFVTYASRSSSLTWLRALRCRNVFDHFHIMFVHSEDVFVRIARRCSLKRQLHAGFRVTPLHFTLSLLQHRSLGRDRIRERTKEQSIKIVSQIPLTKVEVDKNRSRSRKNGNYELMIKLLYVEKEGREETFCKANTTIRYASNPHITSSS